MALFPNIFGTRTPAAADPAVQQQQQAAAATNPTVPSSATPLSTGSTAAIPAAGVGTESPLAKFDELWKTDPNSTQTTPGLVPAFNVDHAKLREAASRVDFTGHIAPDQIQKAMSGDAEAFKAVLNQAVQLGFANSGAMSGELVKNAFATAQGSLTDTFLPNALRQHEISQTIRQDNPAFADPQMAPMLGILQTQLAAKYPTASPQELSGMAKEYLTGMSTKLVTGAGGTIVSQQQQGVDSRGFRNAPEQDWSKFFEGS